MKITGNEPINPIMDNKVLRKYIGLTIRQYYAGLAMRGLMPDYFDAIRHTGYGKTDTQTIRYMAEWAVSSADALIEELNKTEK